MLSTCWGHSVRFQNIFRQKYFIQKRILPNIFVSFALGRIEKVCLKEPPKKLNIREGGYIHLPQTPNIQHFSSDRSGQGKLQCVAVAKLHQICCQNEKICRQNQKKFCQNQGISQFTLLWTPTLQVKPCLCNIKRLAYCTENRPSTHKTILSLSQSRNH